MMAVQAGLLLTVVAAVSASSQYMAIFPKEIRNGMNFGVDVVLFSTPMSGVVVNVAIREQSTDTSSYAWENSFFNINIASGSRYGSNSIMVPYSVETGMEYYVHISFASGLTIKPQAEKVVVTRPMSAIFIQTDKPIYKPGDIVHYRVLNVDKELKPQTEVLTVQIKDAKDNTIMSQRSDSNSGVNLALVSNNFTISDDPIQGDYKIIAETETGYTEATFKVEEYVLPKFEVKLMLDRTYAVQGPDARITGKVKAIYSYGQMVNGKLVLKLSSYFGTKTVLTNNNFNGEQTFSIPVQGEAEQPVTMWYDMGMMSMELSLVAEVNESNTNNMMSDKKTYTMYPAEFAPTLVEPLPLSFVGNSEYSFQVRLTNPLGRPLTDWDQQNQVNSNDLSHYSLRYMVNSGQEMSTSVTQNPMTVTVTLDMTNQYNSIQVWFVYSGSNGKQVSSAQKSFRPTLYYSGSQTKLEVQLVPGSNKDESCFQMTPFKAGERAYYQVINNYYPESVTPYTSTDKHCITLQRKHAPKAVVVVYKLVDYTDANKNPISELLTASAVIDHVWTSEQTVNVSITPKQVKPGENVEIILSATGQSIVGIKGVDKSVSFLADANDVTIQKMVEAVEQFRLFLRPKENPFPNPPMFAQGFPMIERKKRCVACWGQDEYMDPFKLLQEAGLTVITDLQVFRQRTFDYEDNVLIMMAAPMDKNNAANGAGQEIPTETTTNEQPKVEEKIREDFPETWLWDLEMTETNGVKLLTKEVPDTITSWTVDAFAMNQQYGLGVAQTQEVVVFQDFFLSMNLPYSVVRTESFELNILVFNYKDTSIMVSVELATSSNYTVLDPTKRIQTLNIAPGTSSSAIIPIRMDKVGDIPLMARATQTTNTANTDTVIRELIVKPEGREVRRDANLKISMPPSGNEFFFNISDFFNIKGYVPDSLRMYLHVTGDMMGPFIDNLEAQIQMPFGCGEQNIKSLTPSVFVAKYLKTIDRLDSKIEAKVGKVCGAGYRKELIYKHHDGSYSAFGEGPNLCQCGAAGQKKGSTWLTAYVLKTFSLVYVDDLTFVSADILKESFNYLRNNVSYPNCDDQYFVEEGELIHTEMQGGTSSRFGFTAFVLISVMDYLDAAEKAGDAESVADAKATVTGASQWIRSHKTELLNSNRPYQMAISAYALARASEGPDAVAIELINKIESGNMQPPSSSGECMAKPGSESPKRCTQDADCNMEGDNKYYYPQMQCCKVPCGGGDKICSPKPYDSAYQIDSGPSEVELNGYSLMAYLQLYSKTTDSVKRASYQMKANEKKDWLLDKRKGDGFFYSTQDTAVALEALARYAMTFPNTVGADFTVRALVNDAMASGPVTVNGYNYIVNHEEKLTVTVPPDTVSVLVSDGKSGTAFLNLVALYNVNNNVSEDAYLIYIQSGLIDGQTAIRHSFKKNPEFTGNPGTMIVATIHLQSGFTFDQLKSPNDEKLAPAKMEYEKESNTINIYYMNGDDNYNTERQVDIIYSQEFEVSNRQPAVAVVRDYYKQENNVEVLYSANPQKQLCTTNCETGSAVSVQANTILVLFAVAIVIRAVFK